MGGVAVDGDRQSASGFQYPEFRGNYFRMENVPATVAEVSNALDGIEKKLVDLDPLTGVANRNGLKEYVAMFRASHDVDSPLCVILLDVDRFKEINDEYGHSAGDQALVEIARMLGHLSSGAGIVARMGGDEFVVGVAGNLEQGRAFPYESGEEHVRALVGCGAAAPGHEVVIVDPQTRELRADGDIGEIWTAGPSVAAGYWNAPEETEKTFAARLARLCNSAQLTLRCSPRKSSKSIAGLSGGWRSQTSAAML